jgi:NitT/TauT family transport system substrate-binding protein
MPSVSGGEAAVLSAAKEMKTAGMLSPTTDVEALAKKAFVHLDGVTDDWVQKVAVEHLPGGPVPEDQPMRLAAELSTVGTPDKIATCCAPASRVAPRPGIAAESKMAAAK